MPTCYLDDDPHDIVLTNTPISDRWLELFAGQTLQINRPYDTTTIDGLYGLITTHRPLFSKLRLDFLTGISASTQLMHQRNLTDIHAGVVELQRKHTGITDILTKNTQGDWEAIHEEHEFICIPYVSNAWPEPQQEEPRGHIGGASRAMPTASNASSS